jgi:vaccinia related kinase
MLQWLCGKLPWDEDTDDPEYIYSQKENFMSNIPLLMRRCFPNSEPPAALSEYLEYVGSLVFKRKPSYNYCRNVLRQGVKAAGYVNDRHLLFGDSSLQRIIKDNNGGNKRRATEDPKNIAEVEPKKRVCNSPRAPCASDRMARNSPTSPALLSRQQINREKIVSGNPEK